MTSNLIKPANIEGLSDAEIPALLEKYGKNIFHAESSRRVMLILRDIVKEPMFLLLLAGCLIYFLLGEISEGFLMLGAMLVVAGISFYQAVKSANAIKALSSLVQPEVIAIRNGIEITLPAENLLPGDIIILEEGMHIPADASLLQSNDLTINESVITGESLPVDKNDRGNNTDLYQGSTINSGKCFAKVTAIGNNTILGKLGKTVAIYESPKTLLQIQINRLIRRLAAFGVAGFLIILIMNLVNGQTWATSLLFALTLAMSAVPEEIPVAFTSFMALGAYKMSRLGIISRQPQVVENLGAVSVVCLDKTGTITENKMQLKVIYCFREDILASPGQDPEKNYRDVLFYATLASEQKPFDAMEKAILDAFHLYIDEKPHPYTMVHEYPLQGRPPMMTHVYDNGKTKIVAAKGAAERVINICGLNDGDKNRIMEHTKVLALKGYRVLGVASAVHTDNAYPDSQDDFRWKFEGLLALYDPPKEKASAMISRFYEAHIDVKLLTGDYPETAMNIAEQVGIRNNGYVNGEQVMGMKDTELKDILKSVSVFARMFPEAKFKVIEALKASGEIVAMTGDGVNDGPSLKAANIGIAMGKKGTEIARQASDLVLTDDDPEKIVTAIREGRKIFSNLKKAVRYIISIHLPIILTASLPVVLGWHYPNIFSPVHIIFLELIMGPTCSVFFEREPVEENIMSQTPRDRKAGLFTRGELATSIVQGIVISAGALGLYYYFMSTGASLQEVRTIVFSMLIISNVFLTFVNRSFSHNIFHTIRYRNNLAPAVLIISALFISALHFIPVVRDLFGLIILTPGQFGISLLTGFIVVIWIEIFKTKDRNNPLFENLAKTGTFD